MTRMSQDLGPMNRLLRWVPLWVVSALSGGLIFLSVAPRSWWFCAILGIGLSIVGLSRCKTWWGIGLYVWLTGGVYYLLLVPWVGEYVGKSAWLALAGMESLYSLVFGFLLGVTLTQSRRLRSSANLQLHGWSTPSTNTALSFLTVVISIGLFTAVEYIRATWPFGGFPWGRLAWGQVGGPLRGFAPLIGPAVLSVLVLLCGYGLFLVVQKSSRSRIIGVGLALTIFGGGAALTAIHSASYQQDNDSQINVAAIQGNVPRLGLDFNSQRAAVLNNHISETEKLIDEVEKGQRSAPDLVLWPENASDIDPFSNTEVYDNISALADRLNAPIVAGVVTHDGQGSRNAVVVWEPDSGATDKHYKKFLMPFGEWMPYRELLSHVNEYVDSAGNYIPGQGDGVVDAFLPSKNETIAIGVTTCYEVIFDQAFQDIFSTGASLLITPTNNATFGTTNMSYQQLAISQMRAIEFQRSIVVAATSGVSAIIGPNGEVVEQSKIFTDDILQSTVTLNEDTTPALTWGPILEKTLSGLSMILFIGLNILMWSVRKRSVEQAQ